MSLIPNDALGCGRRLVVTQRLYALRSNHRPSNERSMCKYLMLQRQPYLDRKPSSHWHANLFGRRYTVLHILFVDHRPAMSAAKNSRSTSSNIRLTLTKFPSAPRYPNSSHKSVQS
jgi:hypothetical protein